MDKPTMPTVWTRIDVLRRASDNLIGKLFNKIIRDDVELQTLNERADNWYFG